MAKEQESNVTDKDKPVLSIRELTPKQILFVKHFCGDSKLVATHAARKAGYSKKSAAVAGCENLKRANVKLAIEKEMQKRAAEIDVRTEEIIHGLRLIAFPTVFPRKNPVKDSDRLKALELLGKYKLLFSEHHIITPLPIETDMSDAERTARQAAAAAYKASISLGTDSLDPAVPGETNPL